MKFFAIDESQLRALEQLQKRLHTEMRMNGDEMRDAGHTIEAIIHVVKELELPPDGTLKERA